MRKIGFWSYGMFGPALENELRNGWDVVVAVTRRNDCFPFAAGVYVFFKDIGDRVRLPELFRQQGISHLGWEIHGPNGFMVLSEPERVIMEKLLTIYPGAVPYDTATHCQMVIGETE